LGGWFSLIEGSGGELMDIQFLWDNSTTTVLRDEVEARIREDVETDSDIQPCHPGIITAQLHSTDPLEASIKGQVFCSCGKALASFSGNSDGAPLTYKGYI
jgi:hypothetical protein